VPLSQVSLLLGLLVGNWQIPRPQLPQQTQTPPPLPPVPEPKPGEFE